MTGGGVMVSDQVERLVLDVVLSHADDEGILDLNSDVTVLEVDHLTMTHIVLALETQLGIELPTYLEDARTVAELVAGARKALRANAQTKVRPIRMQ
jgi:acyl carrier protein